ncbi:GLEYA domain-containing protein 1 [Elsinoe australis]|uniref:GLEYA domain-containing protein 1 n=1 Tax=Elsinoe australis TaxID=40998 RepID=A0A4U7BC10_9PEZI|nr:GLEYA domain-containing protein 1 [Elsinoe australis]
MADRFPKSAAIIGLLAPLVRAVPVDQVSAPSCSAAVSSIGNVLKANPTADALCAQLRSVTGVTTKTVTPTAGFTSTSVIPIVTDTLTVTAPTSVVTVTATVQTCSNKQKREAATGVRKNLKSKLNAGKTKSAALPKNSTKSKVASKVKSAASKVKGQAAKATVVGGKKKNASKVKSAASKAASKLKNTKSVSITVKAGTGVNKGTTVSAGIPGVITASAQAGITQTLTISGRIVYTVVTPSIRPTVSSIVGGVRTILPPAVTTQAPDFSKLSCASAPSNLQQNACSMIKNACQCVGLPSAKNIIKTVYPSNVPTVTVYNSIAVTYTSVPILVKTATITATGCAPTTTGSAPQAGAPQAGAPAAGSSAAGAPAAGSSAAGAPAAGSSASQSSSASIRQNQASSSASSAGSAVTSAPVLPTGCDNAGVEWAVYSVANSALGNQKRALPIDAGLGGTGSGNGIAAGGVSIFTSTIKSTVSAAAAGAVTSAANVVSTLSTKVTSVASNAQASASAGVSSLIGGLNNGVSSAVGGASSAVAGVSTIASNGQASVSSIVNNGQASISTIASNAQASASSIVNNGQASASKIVNNGQASVSSIVNNGQASISTIASNAQASASKIVNNGQASASSLVNNGQAGISSIAGNAQTTAFAVRSSITSIASNAQASATSIRGSVSSIVVGAQASATSLRGEVPSLIASARAAVQTSILGLRSDALSRLSPMASGVSGKTSNAKDSVISAPSVIDAFKTSGTALVQRAYLIASKAGTYTFTLKSAADQAMLWTGSAAQNAFSDSNVVCVANVATKGSCTYTVDLQQGQYLPYKVLLEHGTGQLSDFDFTLTGPGGDVVKNNVNVMPGNLVRFGCNEDKTFAPVFGKL